MDEESLIESATQIYCDANRSVAEKPMAKTEHDIDASLWERDENPSQLHCGECGAYYITDIYTDNDCPVCGFTAFDVVSALSPSKQVDLTSDE